MIKLQISISTILAIVLSVSVGLSDDRGIRVRESRLALVIGNADYKSSPLKNPVNDARDFSNALKNLGFEVIYRENAGQRIFEEAIRDFGNRLHKLGGIGLFYYAGHGVQVKDDNFLIPVDAQIYQETDIKYEAINAGRILDAMYNASNRMNIVILDACRDNPFARSFRSAAQGLARMDAPTGTIIAYATSPGNVAADGDGRNSYYTKHLLKQMPDPRLNIEKVFKNVRIGVIQETDNRQVPWESSSLTGDFYFNTEKSESPKISSVRPTPSEPPPAVEIEKYETIIQQRKKIREKWDAWQAKLEEQFEKVESYDKSPELTNQEKLEVWETFLASYGANNPYSSKDEELRKTGLSKKTYWESRLTESSTVTGESDRSQKPIAPFKPAEPAKPTAPIKSVKVEKPTKSSDNDIHENKLTHEPNENIRKLLILPFKDVKVGKGKDVDIDVIVELMQTYQDIKIASSYYKSDMGRIEYINKDINSDEIEKIWSADIVSNVEFIFRIIKKILGRYCIAVQKKKTERVDTVSNT